MPEQMYICLDFKVYYYNLNTIVGSTGSLIASLKSVCITGNTELSPCQHLAYKILPEKRRYCNSLEEDELITR